MPQVCFLIVELKAGLVQPEPGEASPEASPKENGLL